MLRTVLLVAAVLLLATPTIWSMAAIGPATMGAVLALSLLCERYIYKPIRNEPPGPGWEKTAERFADPGSGRNVVVYFNPKSGQRRYVAEGAVSDGVCSTR